MKSRSTPEYPDISDLLARKREARRQLAARSFGEKIDMLEQMRARAEPLRRAREARRRERSSPPKA